VNIRDVSKPVTGGVEVNVIVSPNSDTAGTKGLNEWRKRLSIRVRSPPLDGKANNEVIEYFETLTKCKVELKKEHTARQKTVMIYGNAEEIMKALEASL
jgi:uncharacterized protein (TIGR00251 family)